MAFRTNSPAHLAKGKIVSSSVNQSNISGHTRFNDGGSATAQINGVRSVISPVRNAIQATSTRLQGAQPNTTRSRYKVK